MKKKYSIYPLENPDLFDMYKSHRANNWTESEIDFRNDRFSDLSEDHKRMVKKLIFFFANSDAIVADNIYSNLMQGDIPMEAQLFFGYQLYNEHIHMITYGDLIEAYIQNIDEKQQAYDAIFQSDFVAKKLQWANNYATESSSFVESLVAAIAVESIYFSSTFAAIFWLKELKLPLDGLYKANQSILTDEIDHYSFTTYFLKNHVKEEVDPILVKSILLDAVDVEKQFIDDFIGEGVPGVNGDELKKYVEFVCDVVLSNMGYEKHFNTEHNLRFMDGIGIQKTVNFFEKRSSNYIKAEGNVDINLEDF